MVALASCAVVPGDGGDDLKLTGRLTLARLGDLPQVLDKLAPVRRIDLSAIERIDTVGAWLVLRTANAHDAAITGASDDAARLIDAVRRSQEAPSATWVKARPLRYAN
jgi:phospholipid/cholesterol/gamma-HCH transport system permease protein